MHLKSHSVSTLMFLVWNFCIIFRMKDIWLLGQYAFAWVELTFPIAGINIILTCPQALGVYPIIRQALICVYFWYHATDCDTLRMSCLIFFHNNSLGFQCVQPPKHMCTVHFKCLQQWKSLAALSEVTDIQKVFSNHVCYNTQAMPKFQVMNLLYITLLTLRFCNFLKEFGKFVDPSHSVYM